MLPMTEKCSPKIMARVGCGVEARRDGRWREAKEGGGTGATHPRSDGVLRAEFRRRSWTAFSLSLPPTSPGGVLKGKNNDNRDEDTITQ